MLFQLAHWFTVRRDNIDYLQQLRERLKWPIAVEFRGGGWMTNNYRARTLSLLEKLGIVVEQRCGNVERTRHVERAALVGQDCRLLRWSAKRPLWGS
jgi:uncharacterized protein YecE (DUF72 family)